MQTETNKQIAPSDLRELVAPAKMGWPTSKIYEFQYGRSALIVSLAGRLPSVINNCRLVGVARAPTSGIYQDRFGEANRSRRVRHRSVLKLDASVWKNIKK